MHVTNTYMPPQLPENIQSICSTILDMPSKRYMIKFNGVSFQVSVHCKGREPQACKLNVATKSLSDPYDLPWAIACPQTMALNHPGSLLPCFECLTVTMPLAFERCVNMQKPYQAKSSLFDPFLLLAMSALACITRKVAHNAMGPSG